MTENSDQIKSIFLIGTGFWKSSKVLSKHLGETHDFDIVSPIFVVTAFAGEVYLKCIHAIRTAKIRGHKLESLFDGLPEIDRSEIKRIYEEMISNSPIVQTIKTQHPSVNFNLPVVLAEASQTFENWRYAYEKPPNAPVSLGEFVDALQKHILSIDKNLNSTLHVPLGNMTDG